MAGEGFAVMASRDVSYDVPSVAHVLARTKGIVLYEASRFIRDNPGVFDRCAGQSLAESLAGALQGIGIPTVLVPEDSVAEVPEARLVEKGRFEEGKFHFRAAAGYKRMENDFPLDRRVLIACGWVGGTQKKMEWKLDRNYIPTRYGALVLTSRKDQPIRKSVWNQFLDVVPFETGIPHLRFDAMQFKYGSLNTRLFSTRAANFMVLAGLFTVSCLDACVDQSITLLLDDDPRTVAKFVSLKAYDNFLIWKSTLARMAPGEEAPTA